MEIEALRKAYAADLEATSRGAKTPSEPDAVGRYASAPNPDAGTLCDLLEDLPLYGDSYRASVRALLGVLADVQQDPAVRLTALKQLGVAQFQSGAFLPFHAEVIELLRRLAVDADRAVRTAVLDRLTLTNDPVAQQLLTEGLTKARKPLVPAAKAIQLLARDDHGSALQLFRDLAETSSGQIRKQALRALASDTRSTKLFEKIAADKSESIPLREIAATNLRNTSVARFAKLAKRVALDNAEDTRVRAVAVTGLTHTAGIQGLVRSATFRKALASLGARTASRTLKASINRFSKAQAGS